jgi:LDH2 family malate/lactate/ureidoglycolate dehydrogenase
MVMAEVHAPLHASLVKLYPESRIREFTTNMVRGLGGTPEEAAVITDGIATACLWWHPGQGQGLEKFFRYHRRVKNGGIVPGAKLEWVRDGPAFALLEANKAFGYVAADAAMRRALDLASKSGIGVVGVRNSNHFGIAGYHAKTAAEAGFIGVAMTNAKAEMAPWGAKTAVLGTNPWGWSVPRRDAYPIVLDMALTMSGIGMVMWAHREGRAVPDDLALTADGRRTTNPAELLEDSTQLPIGRYKGYGLSFMTDIVTGVLMGAKFGLSVFQDDTDFDVGHIMMAINIESFSPKDRFFERLEALIREVKSATAITPGEEIMLPGEAEHRRMLERKQRGIPVDGQTVERLRPIAADLGVPFSL